MEEIIKEISKITTIEKFRDTMIELLKGYPAYEYFGIFESNFGKELGEMIVKILSEDRLIKVFPRDGRERYRLTPDGIRFAVSMINLKYGERANEQTEKMIKLTKVIGWLTVVMLIIALISASLAFIQINQNMKQGRESKDFQEQSLEVDEGMSRNLEIIAGREGLIDEEVTVELAKVSVWWYFGLAVIMILVVIGLTSKKKKSPPLPKLLKTPFSTNN